MSAKTDNANLTFDSRLWRKVQVGGFDALFTARGTGLLSRTPEITDHLEQYLIHAAGGVAVGAGQGVRRFFGNDSNGQVYTLNHGAYGNGMLVKETNGHSMPKAVERLDRIKAIIDKQVIRGKLPAWIDVPDHYGVVLGPRDQYVVMQGIDSGVNVRDIIELDKLNAKERLGVESVVGPVSEATKSEVNAGYTLAETLLSNAIAEETQQVPTRLLSDWHPGNVVLEQLAEPIDGSNYKYWVIDQ
jgi:hypothetical protein